MGILYSRGFLEVSSLPSGRIAVGYAGNMGHRLENVREIFESIFGMGSFAKLIANSEVKGSPDYSWSAVLSGEDFKRISPAYSA